MLNRHWLWLALAWFAASVYALLFRLGSDGPPPFAHFDKAAHFALFFAQFWLLAKACRRQSRPLPLRPLLLAAVAWACGSEILQAVLNNGRQGDVWDVAADIAGAACALWLARQIERERAPASPPAN